MTRMPKTLMHQSARKKNIQPTEWRDAVEKCQTKMIPNHLKPRLLQTKENHENNLFSKSWKFFVKFMSKPIAGLEMCE